MPRATEPFRDRIALVFDFDDTLADSSYDTLLRACGLDSARFREETVQPLSEAGWDDTLARFYTLIIENRRRDDLCVDREFLARVGRDLEPFPGVPEMFGRVRDHARELRDSVEVEFYLLSCGFVDIHRSMDIAGELEALWGSEFHFGEDGQIDFIRQMVTFPEKVRYLLALSKGLSMEGPNEPGEVYRDVDHEQVHVPLSQMIYVGDGGSDMPAFELMSDHGGIALGVFRESSDEWTGREQMRASRRVQNLAAADYGEDSELMRSIRSAVSSICHLIDLRELSEGE